MIKMTIILLRVYILIPLAKEFVRTLNVNIIIIYYLFRNEKRAAASYDSVQGRHILLRLQVIILWQIIPFSHNIIL